MNCLHGPSFNPQSITRHRPLRTHSLSIIGIIIVDRSQHDYDDNCDNRLDDYDDDHGDNDEEVDDDRCDDEPEDGSEGDYNGDECTNDNTQKMNVLTKITMLLSSSLLLLVMMMMAVMMTATTTTMMMKSSLWATDSLWPNCKCWWSPWTDWVTKDADVLALRPSPYLFA